MPVALTHAMIEAMVREHIDYYTFTAASAAWGRPMPDIVQMAANGVIDGYAIAKKWQTKEQETLQGWVVLDAQEILHSLDSALIKATRVKQGDSSYELETPQELYWGSVYVDAETYSDYEQEEAEKRGELEVKDVLLSPKRVAKILDIQPDTLNKWRQDGKGPKWVKMSGNTVRYKKSDVEDYLAKL